MQTMADKKKAVIPANAGVILFGDDVMKDNVGYPRECGGDPESAVERRKII